VPSLSLPGALARRRVDVLASAAFRALPRRGPERLFLALSGAGYAVMSLVWFLIPSRRFHLYREGEVVETITAVLFLAAAVTTVRAMRRAGLRWRHPYVLIVPIALFCFGEEVSWARHALDIDRPRVLWLKVDAVHDLVILVFALYVQHGSWRSRLTVALGAAIVVAVVAATRHLVLYPLARVVLASAVWRLVAVAVGLIGLSLALDLDLLPWRYVKAFEEMTELNAVLALFLASRQINTGTGQSTKRPSAGHDCTRGRVDRADEPSPTHAPEDRRPSGR
jgi:hypothetical protein